MSIQPNAVTVETRRLGHVVGMAQDFTMQTRGEIPLLWRRYFETAPAIRNAVPGGMYGVSFKADGKGGFRYGVGVGVDPVPGRLPKGTCKMVLSEGAHAVLRVFGPVADLPSSFDYLFSTWLPTSGFTQRDGAVFEYYPDDAANGPEAMSYEIWVPVEPAS